MGTTGLQVDRMKNKESLHTDAVKLNNTFIKQQEPTVSRLYFSLSICCCSLSIKIAT